MRYVLVLVALLAACSAPDPAFVEAANKACAAQMECELSGACGYDTSAFKTGREIAPGVFVSQCAKTTDAHCAGSSQCKMMGQCSLVDGMCRARESKDCIGSDGCKTFGKCTAREGQCFPGSDADCERSHGCALGGHCRVLGDKCVEGRRPQGPQPEPALTEDVIRMIRVNARYGGCEAECIARGACTHTGKVCEARLHNHCKQSDACKVDGACSLIDGACGK